MQHSIDSSGGAGMSLCVRMFLMKVHFIRKLRVSVVMCSDVVVGQFCLSSYSTNSTMQVVPNNWFYAAVFAHVTSCSCLEFD